MVAPTDFWNGIVADYQADLPRLIFADWLEEQGNPLGELIRVQCELEHCSPWEARTVRLKARERVLLSSWRQEWSGDIRRVTRNYLYERGLPLVVLTARKFLDHAETLVNARPLPVVGIRLTQMDMDAEEFARSSALRQLRVFSVGGSSLRSDQFRQATASPNLESVQVLNAARCKVAKLDLSGLSRNPQLPSLRQLNLTNTTVLREDMQCLRKIGVLDRLTALNLAGPRCASGVINALASDPNPHLESLNLSEKWWMRGELVQLLTQSAHFPALQSLDLSDCQIRWLNVAQLCQNPAFDRLQSLRLGMTSYYTIEDAPLLTRAIDETSLPALERLEISPLVSLSQLRSFFLSPVFRRLKVFSTRQRTDPVLLSLLAESSRQGNRLEALSLDQCQSEQGIIAPLTESVWPCLKSLRLRSSDLRDEDLEALARTDSFPALERLDLLHGKFTTRGLQALAAAPLLQTLRSLNLEGCTVSYDGLRALASVPAAARLVTLGLARTDITDRNSTKCRQLLESPDVFPNLQELEIREGSFDYYSLNQLRKRYGPALHVTRWWRAESLRTDLHS